MSKYYQSTDSISIQAAPEKAYEALTNWTIRSQWRKGVILAWEGDAKAFVGQKVRTKMRGVLPYSFEYRITGLEAPYRVFMDYTGNPLKGRCALEIVPEDKGCQVSFYWMKVEPKGLLAKIYFALGLGSVSHRSRSQETLRMLKEYLESKG